VERRLGPLSRGDGEVGWSWNSRLDLEFPLLWPQTKSEWGIRETSYLTFAKLNLEGTRLEAQWSRETSNKEMLWMWLGWDETSALALFLVLLRKHLADLFQ
jgi:hypothetical protein